ncbi:hypothetical protein [Brevundimonas subvibrioides]|uniref:hypothetical protein n=1 Tax=Brevundimonas subvibrioides TaxID=74313 RepID=UPI0022B5259C|nr:hypothetical protein [Brevundimonas subvibrioides]
MQNDTEFSFDERLAATRARRKARERKIVPWLITAVAITAVWAFLGSVSQVPSGSMAYDIGTSVGQALFIGLFVGFVLWLIAGRRLAPDRVGGHLALLMGVAFLAALLPIGFGSLSRGQAGRDFQLLAQDRGEFLREIAVIEARSATALAVFDSQDVMAPQALKDLRGIDVARAELSELKAAAKANAAEARTLEAEFSTRLRNRISDNEDLQQFDRGRRDAMAEFDRIIELDSAIYTSMEAQLDILERQRWQPSGREFVFSNESDLAAFNEEARKQETAAAEIEQLKAAAARRKDAFDDFMQGR